MPATAPGAKPELAGGSSAPNAPPGLGVAVGDELAEGVGWSVGVEVDLVLEPPVDDGEEAPVGIGGFAFQNVGFGEPGSPGVGSVRKDVRIIFFESVVILCAHHLRRCHRRRRLHHHIHHRFLRSRPYTPRRRRAS